MQTRDALKHVKQNAQHAFLCPIILTAAHTGMRRSGLIRAEIDDFDLQTKTIHVREKKRVRGRITMRVVPMSELLCETLDAWVDFRKDRDCPRTRFVFVHPDAVQVPADPIPSQIERS